MRLNRALAQKLGSRVVMLGEALGCSAHRTPQEAAAFLEACSPDVKSSAISEEKHFPETEMDLSVIVPTYNRAERVCRAIASVLSQKTSYSWELIIVNDGSPDHTAEVLKSYEQQKNVRVLHQTNGGLSAARNAGMALARRAYVTFLDDDDALLPGALEALLKEARTFDADIVEGGYLRSYADGSQELGKTAPAGEVSRPLGTLNGFPWGKVYRRSLFDRVQFPVGYWYEDSINSGLLYSMAKTCRIIPHPVYEYVLGEQNMTVVSIGKPKTLDSLYITRQLLRDRETLGLVNGQAEYEYFLRMVRLTFDRTQALGPEIQQAVFAVWCGLYHQYYEGFSTEKSGAVQRIERALKRNRYRSFAMHCVCKI